MLRVLREMANQFGPVLVSIEYEHDVVVPADQPAQPAGELRA